MAIEKQHMVFVQESIEDSSPVLPKVGALRHGILINKHTFSRAEILYIQYKCESVVSLNSKSVKSCTRAREISRHIPI